MPRKLRMEYLNKHKPGPVWLRMESPDQHKPPPVWYGVSFVAVMGACAVLVVVLEGFGLSVDGLRFAVLAGTLFHTLMSMEGVNTVDGLADPSEDETMRVKIALWAGALGGLIDVVSILLLLLIGNRLDGGSVAIFILFMTGLMLPPALGLAAGFHLARKIVKRNGVAH